MALDAPKMPLRGRMVASKLLQQIATQRLSLKRQKHWTSKVADFRAVAPRPHQPLGIIKPRVFSTQAS
eukprot:4382917-Pyramimonas_sp.AAC.1